MRCPFLREEQVKSCQASPFRKSIARSAAHGEDERCSSPDYVRCPVAPQSRQAHPSPARCPFLVESLVQFCAAAPAPTYIPWSESPLLRCGHDGHRFCELFLSVAGRGGRGPARRGTDAEDAGTGSVDGIAMPGWLYYAPNHMWLDEGDDGLFHLGVDAFLTGLAGSVERLAFLTVKGVAHPAVVLTIGGVDLTLAFPHALKIVSANTRLRSSVQGLVADPYGVGWLFEGKDESTPPRRTGSTPITEGLLRGAAARQWMEGEVRRASLFVHERVLPRRSHGDTLPDGGTVAAGLVSQLDRDETLQLFAELFPLPGTTRRSS
jgi:glycine cleavage system H lipoate-binding protein